MDVWNKWRSEDHSIKPNLSGEDLAEMDLDGVDFSEADLSDTDLFGSSLNSANLKMASLTNADLSDCSLVGAELYKADLTQATLLKVNMSGADLGATTFSKADLRGSNLSGANLEEADLSGADLRESSLSAANLSRANIVGTRFQFSDLSSVNAIAVQYLPHSSMRGNYHGVRGLESCFGNAIFVRDAKDQDYIDTLEISIHSTVHPLHKKLKIIAFKTWEWIDFGRSLAKPTMYGTAIAVFFGLIFLLDMYLAWGLIDFSSSSQSPLTPFYFSIVTFTTLGYGDVLPTSWIGEILVIFEVVLGYSTLGLLLSILANKVARRS